MSTTEKDVFEKHTIELMLKDRRILTYAWKHGMTYLHVKQLYENFLLYGA